MEKTILHVVIILLVAGLVAGGVYLFVQHGGMSLVGGAAGSEGFSRGGDFARGGPPSGTNVINLGGFNGGDRGGEGGFSLAGIGGVLMQAVKVAAITAFVVAVQAVIRLFKRRRKTASPLAA